MVVGLYRSDIWPGGMPNVGQTAERSRTVTADDIVRFAGGQAHHQTPDARDPRRWNRRAGRRCGLLHRADRSAYLPLDRIAAAVFLNNARSIASAIALYPASPGCR